MSAGGEFARCVLSRVCLAPLCISPRRMKLLVPSELVSLGDASGAVHDDRLTFHGFANAAGREPK